MEVIPAMLGRVSCPKLVAPGPSAAELDTLLRCALRAPDHGLLRPWRFLVVQGEARQALGELFAEAERIRNPQASPEALDKLRRNPLRAPVVLVCVAVTVPGHKVPVIEQVASTAAAVQNLQLAADALGYGAMWRTGPMASDPHVKACLGFEARDEIVAFLYLGSVDGERRRAEVPDPAAYARAWTGR